jgi:hypothetical protein
LVVRSKETVVKKLDRTLFLSCLTEPNRVNQCQQLIELRITVNQAWSIFIERMDADALD